jgi:hypothetical protein
MGHAVFLAPRLRRGKHDDLLREMTGCDPTDPASVAAAPAGHGIEAAGRRADVVKSDLFESTIDPAISGRVFVID